MTQSETRRAALAKRTNSTTSATGGKPKIAEKQPSLRMAASNEIDAARVTKHDRILTLLNRRDGATIPEMMETSGWQQHSVRGFLAGTVKKKLGFTLTSSKSEGELRRYRIDHKRGR